MAVSMGRVRLHGGGFYRTIKYVIIPYITMVQTPSQSALLPAAQAFDRAPAILQRAGKNALFAANEFFAARISNPHTRRAYARIVGRFLSWCEEQGIELRQVTPGLAGRFIEELPGSDPGGENAPKLLNLTVPCRRF